MSPSSSESLVVRYAQFIIRWRWLVIPICFALAMVGASGARYFGMGTDYRVYFGPDNPQLIAFDEVQNVYTKNDNLLFTIAPADGNVFTRDTLKLVKALTEESWTLPYALRVDSITNFQHTEALNDDLHVADLFDDIDALTDAEIEHKMGIALAEPLLKRRLISETGHATVANLLFQIPGESIEEVPTAVAAAREMRERLHEQYPGHRIYMSGTMMMNNAFSEAGQNDMAKLYPLMYGMIMLITFIMLRSIWGMLSTITIVMLSAISSAGAACYFGIQYTPPSLAAPTIISTLAVADSVHILVSMYALIREGMSKHEAIAESLRLNMMPVFLTSVTTALGFLSINFADSPPLRDLGNIAAGGVMVAFFFSVTLLPALASIFPAKSQARKTRLAGVMQSFGEFVTNNRRPVLIGSLIGSIGLIALAPQNEANDLFAHWFGESIEFRRDTDFTVNNVTGLYTMEFSLQAGESNGVSNPEYLKKLEAFKNWWEQHPKVMHVGSVSDIFTRLNKNMHGDDAAWYKIPDNKELAAQYLLLYEMSLPYGLDLNSQIDIDKSATRFLVVFEHLTSRETREIAEAGQQWMRDNAPEMFNYGVSPAVMFAYISERNIKSMFIGMPIALIGISFILIFALRDLKIGLLSLVPNLVPLGIAFGVWAIVEGEVQFTMSVALGMVIGVVVDDTIHFLSKYLRARKEMGYSPEHAMHYAFRTVGVALLVTTAILVGGFLIIAQSAFVPNSGMALITVIALISALVADFLLLPSLLLTLDKDSEETTDQAAVQAT